MDKHNSQQKNKSKNGKKPASVQASPQATPEAIAVKDDQAATSGKKSGASAGKKK